MSWLFAVVLGNTLAVGLLIVLLTAIKGWIRNPAVLHTLYVLALIKLVTPPLYTSELHWLPNHVAAVSGTTSNGNANSPSSPEGPDTSDALNAASYNTPNAWVDSVSTDANEVMALSNYPVVNSLIGLIWFAGTVWCLWLATLRISRFNRCLAEMSTAPIEPSNSIQQLAKSIGLLRVPRIFVIPGRFSPMVWGFPGRSCIIMPAQLSASLSNREWETLLLHELVHYRRHDHWVRLLELVTTAFYWWNPMVWWLRKRIRVAEELVCDAWVVRAQPERRRLYAEALVKSIGFLSSPLRCELTTGVGSYLGLRDRITHIMNKHLDASLSRPSKRWILVLAMMFIAFGPAFAQREQTIPEKPGAEHTDTLIADPVGKDLKDQNGAQPPVRKIELPVLLSNKYVVGEVSDEIHRELVFWRSQARVYVLANVESLIRKDGSFDKESMSTDDLVSALRKLNREANDEVFVKLHFSAGVDRSVEPGVVDLLKNAVEEAGFKKVRTGSAFYNGRSNWLIDVVSAIEYVKTHPDAQDIVKGDDEIKVYAFHSFLGRWAFGDTCYLRVLKPLSKVDGVYLTDEIRNQIAKYVNELRLEKKTRITFSFENVDEDIKRQREAYREHMMNAELPSLTEQLGFERFGASL